MFETNRYSVPRSAAFAAVTVKTYVDRAAIAHGGHLVVELKRPSQVTTSKEVFQIQRYAVAVAEDERFRDIKTKWTFWLVSNEIDALVRRLAKQKNRPEGLLQDDDEGRFVIWVKTWGQIVRECNARHEFIRERLGYTPDQESAVKHLQAIHKKFLPQAFKAGQPPDDAEPIAAL